MKLPPYGQSTPIPKKTKYICAYKSAWDLAIPFRQEKSWRRMNEETPRSFQQLEEFLVKEEWKNANDETIKIFSRVLGVDDLSFYWLSSSDKALTTSEDLTTIDRLWTKHSDGLFGLSVQKLIYDCSKAIFLNEYQDVLEGDKLEWKLSYRRRENPARLLREEFGASVGWFLQDWDWLSYSRITFDKKMPEELYYKFKYASTEKCLTPCGHLPVINTASTQCGFNCLNFAIFPLLSILGST